MHVACCVATAHVSRLQVDQLSAQLKEAQQQLEDKQRMATSLSGAERGRLEAEEKLAAALRHNTDTQVGVWEGQQHGHVRQHTRKCSRQAAAAAQPRSLRLAAQQVLADAACWFTMWCVSCATSTHMLLLLYTQADLMKLQEQLRAAEGRQARVGAVATSELESALASVRGVLGRACTQGLLLRCCLLLHVTHSLDITDPCLEPLVTSMLCLATVFACVCLCCHCHHQVSELKVQLQQARSQQDKLRAEVAAAAAARDAAHERTQALKREVEQLQFMLDEVHAARSESPAGKVGWWCDGQQAAMHASAVHTLAAQQLRPLWCVTDLSTSTLPFHFTHVTTVTHVTHVTPVTHVTHVTPVTHVTSVASHNACLHQTLYFTQKQNPRLLRLPLLPPLPSRLMLSAGCCWPPTASCRRRCAAALQQWRGWWPHAMRQQGAWLRPSSSWRRSRQRQ